MHQIKPMKCPNCKKEIPYNHHYQCYECQCGEVYNALGNELAPLNQWKDEYDNEEY